MSSGIITHVKKDENGIVLFLSEKSRVATTLCFRAHWSAVFFCFSSCSCCYSLLLVRVCSGISHRPFHSFPNGCARFGSVPLRFCCRYIANDNEVCKCYMQNFERVKKWEIITHHLYTWKFNIEILDFSIVIVFFPILKSISILETKCSILNFFVRDSFPVQVFETT